MSTKVELSMSFFVKQSTVKVYSVFFTVALSFTFSVRLHTVKMFIPEHTCTPPKAYSN